MASQTGLSMARNLEKRKINALCGFDFWLFTNLSH